jgi:hypothetical protein
MKAVALEPAVLLPKLRRLPAERRVALLYRARGSLSEEDFRHLAALLSIDLARADSPRRWARLGEIEEALGDSHAVVGDDLVASVGPLEEIVNGEEYLGESIVRRRWRSSTL